MNQLLPLLSRFLPAGLAVKGISKVNPRIGSFITNAATAGYTADSIMDFLRDRFQPEGQKIEKQAKEILSSLRAIQKDYEKVGGSLSILQKHLTNAGNVMGDVLSVFTSLGQKISSTRNLGVSKEAEEVKLKD